MRESLGVTATAAGGVVRGEAAWEVPATKGVELLLLWFTRGPLGEEAHIVSRRQLLPRPTGREAFEFAVPATPQSYVGDHTSLLWAVELVINPRRRFARAEFQVGEAWL